MPFDPKMMMNEGKLPVNNGQPGSFTSLAGITQQEDQSLQEKPRNADVLGMLDQVQSLCDSIRESLSKEETTEAGELQGPGSQEEMMPQSDEEVVAGIPPKKIMR